MSEGTTAAAAREWSEAFGLLSALMFDEPTDEMLGALADEAQQLPASLAAWKPCCEALAEARANGSFDQVREAIDVDFARLFANASNTPVHPYESMYRNAEKLLMREERDQVVAAYLETARAVDDGRNLPEDHAGYELAFLAELCAAEANALDTADGQGASQARAALRSFFDCHANAWLGALAGDIARLAQTDFYCGFAAALEQALLGFEAYLAESGDAR